MRLIGGRPGLAKRCSPSERRLLACGLLNLARVKNGQYARDDLEKKAAGLKVQDWPGRIIELYLERATKPVLSAAKDAEPRRNKQSTAKRTSFSANTPCCRAKKLTRSCCFARP